MKRQITLFISLIIIITISLQLYGQNAQIVKAHVLIIGNGEYTDEEILDLPGALEDARRMKETLIELGMADEQDITVLTDQIDLTKTRLEIKIKNFLQDDYGEGDTLIFYYSGHGYTKEDMTDNDLYLVPSGTDENDLDSYLINFNNILKNSLDKIEDKKILIFVDSCYSGTLLKDINKGSKLKSYRPKSVLEMIEGTNVNIMVASDAKEEAKEEAGQGGYFTKFLIEGLLTGKANSDEDGYITFGELGEYVKKNVTKQQSDYRGNEDMKLTIAKDWIIERIKDELQEKYQNEEIDKEVYRIWIGILDQLEDKDTEEESEMRDLLIGFYKSENKYDDHELSSLKEKHQELFSSEDLEIKKPPTEDEKTLKRDTDNQTEPSASEESGNCILKITTSNELAKTASVYLDGKLLVNLEKAFKEKEDKDFETEGYQVVILDKIVTIEGISVGEHTLKLDSPVMNTIEESITFEKAEIKDIKIEATPAEREIRLKTLPSGAYGAEVTVNGKKEGTTPYQLPAVIGQQYHVKFEKDLFHTQETTITIEEKGKLKEIYIELVKDQPPPVPEKVLPKRGTVIKKEVILEWLSVDPEGDPVIYDVYFGKGDRLEFELETQENKCSIKDLEYDTQYSWQIIAKDQWRRETDGPIWQFKTSQEPTICRITYQVDPEDVNIIVDGIQQEKKTITLTRGSHLVVFESLGYKRMEKKVEISSEDIENGDKTTEIILEKEDMIVDIQTNPEEAKVYLDGKVLGYSNIRTQIEWGKDVTIKVEKEGYKVTETEKKIQSQEISNRQEIMIDLEKLPTQLKLSSNEPKTEYFVNGEKASEDATIIYWGTQYEVKAQKNGFKKEIKTINLPQHTQEYDCNFILEKETVPLIVEVSQKMAKIYVDGFPKGKGTLNTEIEWGEPLEIKVEKEGYKEVTATIHPTISDIEKGIFLKIDLEERKLNRKITSIPEMATIKINGEIVGETPFSYDFIWGERYQIVLEKDGYQNRTKIVTIDDNVSDIVFYLEKLKTELSITSETEDVVIKVNDEILGKTPVDKELIWGETYRLVASKEGYEDYTKELKLNLSDAGKKIVEEIQLKKKATTILVDTRNVSKTKIYLDGEFLGVTPL